jgi:TetR/AcrR family transcriptional regulator, transcriptional repressor for nem operon
MGIRIAFHWDKVDEKVVIGYRDKRGMLIAALTRYSEERIERLAQSFRAKHPSRDVLRHALLYYIQAVTDLDRFRACFITNTALELTPEDTEVAHLINRIFRRMVALWTEAATRARNEGYIDLTLDAVVVGNYLLCVVQGLRVLGKIYDRQELTNMVDMALRALEPRPAQLSKA